MRMFGMTGKDRLGWEQMVGALLGKVCKPEFDVDVLDLGDSFRVEADLPGLQKGEVKVDLAGEKLTIAVNRGKSGSGEYGHFIRRERLHGTAKRTFDISAVDTELVTAQYDNGVLTIQLPKKECARTSVRSVTVE